MSASKFDMWVAGWFLVVFCWLVLTPLQLFFLFRFLGYRSINAVYSRGLGLVLAQTLCGLFCSVIQIPSWSLEASSVLSGTGIEAFKSWMFAAGLYSSAAVLTWRVWHLRYKIEESHHRQKTSWAVIIDSSKSAENDWWLTHKVTYGDSRYTLKRIIIPYVVISTIINGTIFTLRIYEYLPLEASAGVSVIPHFFHIGIVIYNWYNISPFEDDIFIRSEFVFSIVTYIVGVSIYIIVFGCLAAIDASQFVFYYLSGCAALLSIISQSLLSTGFILWKGGKFLKPNTAFTISKSSSIGTQIQLQNKPNSLQSNSGVHSLPPLLENTDGFEGFMEFLLKSFEAECMLSFIELLQFRKTLSKAFRLELSFQSQTKIDYDAFVLAPCVPRSAIVAPIRAYMATIAEDAKMANVNAPPKPHTLSVASSHGLLLPNTPFGGPITQSSAADKIQPISLPDSSATSNAMNITPQGDVADNTTPVGMDGGVSSPDLNRVGSESPIPRQSQDMIEPDDDDDDEDLAIEISQFSIGTITGTRRDVAFVICRAAARRLFLKYIEIGSPYEVNISAKERKKLISLIRDEVAWKLNEDIDEEILFNIFNRCIDEMYQFLLYSFRRYTSDDRYKKWLTLRNSNHSILELSKASNK